MNLQKLDLCIIRWIYFVGFIKFYNEEIMNADEILRALPFHYYIIDLKKKYIVKTNDSKVKPGKKPCFIQLFFKQKPCLEIKGKCICEQMLKNDSAGSFILESFENGTKKFFKAPVFRIRHPF